MKVKSVLFQDSKARTIWQFEYQLSSDMDIAVLSFSHTLVTSTFQDQPLLSQTVAELCPSVHSLCPSQPHPLAQIKTMWVCMTCKFSEPKGILSGTEALNLTLTVLVLLIVVFISSPFYTRITTEQKIIIMKHKNLHNSTQTKYPCLLLQWPYSLYFRN